MVARRHSFRRRAPSYSAPNTIEKHVKRHRKISSDAVVLFLLRQRPPVIDHLTTIALERRIVVLGPAVTVDVTLVLLEFVAEETPFQMFGAVPDLSHVKQ